jgi:peptidoglycan hydrolase-like protein with peptidoglycan-binding domain
VRQMLDSVSSARIPVGTPIVAGYIDGAYRWSDADWRRHALSVHVGIAVFASTHGGQVLDVERGNATPSQVPAWAISRRLDGVVPTVYASVSRVAEIRYACANAGVPMPLLWTARWDGIAVIPPGSVAHQYLNGPDFDSSIVSNHWPGVDGPRPYPGALILQGATGELVVEIQRVVSASPDGIFGPITRARVQAWQSAHGLVADGVVGPLTWASLFG